MHNIYEYIKTFIWLLIILLILIILEKIPKTFSYSNHILINEVLYNPEGTDTGNEWIELYNSTDVDIDLTDWKIEKAGTTFEQVLIIEQSLIIPSEEFILICGEDVIGCDLYTAKLGFQNGGTATDGIRILDNNNVVVDALFYDTPNTNQLVDESGIIVTDGIISENASSGESLGRINYIDTGNYKTDFKIFSSPTPKEINRVEQESEEIINSIEEEEIIVTYTAPKERTELIETGYNILPIYILSSLFLIFIIHKYSAMLHKY